MYLNYTDDTNYLLQLEYVAMNYIEENVTNEYCRNYIKAALCVTIYPPCDDGVHKLCSDVCDTLLNSGTCSDDRRHLIEHITNVEPNLFINFTVNCSDSLIFSKKFLSTMPCESNMCISLIEIAETPAT